MAKPFSTGLVFSGFIIAGLLAASAYYTYRTQTANPELSKTPASATTSTIVEKIVTTTPKITCAIADKKLATNGKTQTMEITRLVPVELNVHPGFITNDSSWLVFKHFNGGGPSFEVEDSAALSFAGQGPWYTTEILEPKGNNVSIVPTFNAPPEIEQLLAGGPNSGTSGIGVGDNWFILVNETGGMGDGPSIVKQTFLQIQNTAPNTIERIAIPAEYGPKNDNPNALVEVMGRYNSLIVFGLNSATSTYAGFDYKTRKWQKLTDGDTALKGLTRKNRPDFKASDLIKEHGCFVQDSNNGFMVFVPHFLETQVLGNSPTLDIYWYDDNDTVIHNWDRLKTE